METARNERVGKAVGHPLTPFGDDSLRRLHYYPHDKRVEQGAIREEITEALGVAVSSNAVAAVVYSTSASMHMARFPGNSDSYTKHDLERL